MNVIGDPSKYRDFWEELGSKFPGSEIRHADKSRFSRFGNIMSELKPFAVAGKSLLDIGCNDGVYTIPYVLIGGTAHGIDISPSVISKAKAKAERLRLRNISFSTANIENFQCSEKYDVALMTEVLQHVTDPSLALRNVSNCIEPNGYFILTTPTPLHWFETLVTRHGFNFSYVHRLFKRKLKEEHTHSILKTESILAKYGIGDYTYRYDGYFPIGLRDYVEKFGFKCVRYYTLFYHKERIWLNWLGFALRKIPMINLLGNNNILIFQRNV